MRYIAPEKCIKDRLGERRAPQWDAAVLVFRDFSGSKGILDAFAPVEPVRYRLIYNMTSDEFEPLVYEARVDGKTIAIVTRLVWGGPQVAIVVEELASLGVSTLLGYGVAGSIDSALERGAFIVAESGLPTDGTSRAYGSRAPEAADAAVMDRVVSVGREMSCELTPVAAATVDALYRETPELLEGYREQGGRIVNLETTPFYAASRVCGVHSVWFGYITDRVIGAKWDDWTVPVRNAAETCAKMCVRLVTDLPAGTES